MPPATAQTGDSSRSAITRILEQMAAGDMVAADRLAPLIYGDLRRLAHHYLRNERLGHTLQPTALVHEAFLRIVGIREASWESRTHFIGVAANIMRRILIDYARRRHARPEGRIDPNGSAILGRMGAEQAGELVSLDKALKALAAVDSRQARIVELRFFGGLSIEEIAHLLNLSSRTVKRDWALAKIWLRDELDRH